MFDLEDLKAKVAATMGARPSMLVIINSLADQFDETLAQDGLDKNSKTAQLVASMRKEAESITHLAQIGTPVRDLQNLEGEK